MISGSIRTYEEPVKYVAPAYSFGYMGGDDSYCQAPPYHKQHGVLESALAIGKQLGFIVGAKVKRRSGSQTVGEITNVHTIFSQAWNYTVGELEPYKVKWDNGNVFDYGMADLILEQKETYENVSNLY